jgi:predicted transcriptional regulator
MIILFRLPEIAMAPTERVTVTLPVELVERIDRLERNRSRFIAEAVEHELVQRRRDGLLRSLKRPHPEAALVAEAGLADWGASLPADDEGLLDASAGKPVRWVEGTGWVKDSA